MAFMHEWHDMTSGWNEYSRGTSLKESLAHTTRQSTSLYSHNFGFALQLALIKLFVVLVTENRWTCILAHVDAASSIR